MEHVFENYLRKACIVVITAFLIIGGTLPAFAVEEPEIHTFSGGEGTKSNPYLISSLDDLIDLSQIFTKENAIRDAHFKLTTDIDLGATVWNPIGSNRISFSGVFDGNGKRITVRKMAEDHLLGIFGATDFYSLIKNLKVKGIINQKIAAAEEVCFGLVAARAEGTIENCVTEGSVVLTADMSKDLYFGGAVGFGRGTFSYIQNDASLTLTRKGDGYTALGGIIGSSRGNTVSFSHITNTGTIDAKADGTILAGGIVGEYGFGPDIYNALNQGNISIVMTKLLNGMRAAAGGITGEIRESNIDKALNKGKVYVDYAGSIGEQEIIAGGVTGMAEYGKLTNVGNEGAVDARNSKVAYAAGIIGAPGRDVSLTNTYNKGSVYGTSPDRRSELYIEGMVGNVATVDNFYNSGSVRLKAGNLKEIDGEAITNIRPGENTKTFNYGYWSSGRLPFPLLQKAQLTTSEFNPANGKLSRNVNIGGKQYNYITEALNAWIGTQKGDYLKWTGQNTPVFDWSFGYSMPEQAKYTNQREGKWQNISDWAYEWMDKADKLDIIPEILRNEDMTKGITRKEFSALAVKLYEKLSGKTAIADINSPFTDTQDQSVIKAYRLGIVSGIGNGLFAPDTILTREQASVMLTRVYKAVYWEGWTFAEDETYSRHVLDREGVAKFSDDSLISSWAREPVYFMAKNSILCGIGGNIFAPSYKAGEKESYGRATREQAFKIAAAMIEKFNNPYL